MHTHSVRTVPHHARLVGPALSQASRMFSRTAAGRTRIIVIVSSAAIDDAAQLQQQKTSDPSNSILNTLATSDVQIVGVTLRPTEPQTVDSMAASASLNLLTAKTLSTTMTEFADQVLYGMCGNQMLTVGAFFQCPQAHLSVATIRTGRRASLHPVLVGQCRPCLYPPAVRNTAPKLLVLPTRPACTRATCVSTSCDPHQSTCTDTVCQWNTAGGYCATPCISNPNEDACIADTTATCTYFESSSTGCVVTSCTYSSESVCLQILPACGPRMEAASATPARSRHKLPVWRTHSASGPQVC